MDRKIILEFYKRKEVQEAILDCAKDREVSCMFGIGKFGKRPDVLQYPGDILELVKNGATSFHSSEERWRNPLLLAPSMSRKDLDENRLGWDLVLDIDCKFIEYSKVCADLLVQALKYHGIKNVNVKFSGGSGFHIGVCFESFPLTVNGKDIRLWFPEGPRLVAAYLKEMIKDHLAAKILEISSIEDIIKKSGKQSQELLIDGLFNPFSILEIDTVLISSRHMFRMPYCFNEKSGLVSVPVDPNFVDKFDIKETQPRRVIVNKFKFLDRSKAVPGEAKQLLVQAFDFQEKNEDVKVENKYKDFEAVQEAIPVKFFPPCIQKILGGLEDGKKRSVFILANFLTSCGWDYEQIEKLLADWNKKNKEPLKEVLIKGPLRYHKTHNKKVLPPNCDNSTYYKDLRVCVPDNLCSRIKNPVSYARRRSFAQVNQDNKKKKKKS